MFTILAIALMIAALLTVPLGLPGTWLMLGVLLVGVVLGELGLATLLALAGVATVAEIIEFIAVKTMSDRYGGSGRAFWGAIAGGIIGVLMGMPVPVVGPLLAGMAGTFVGAAAVTLVETGRPGPAARVGWGVALARVLAVAAKTAAGIVILVAGATGLVVE